MTPGRTVENVISQLDLILNEIGTPELVEVAKDSNELQLIPGTSSKSFVLPDRDRYDEQAFEVNGPLINSCLNDIAETIPASATQFSEFCLRHVDRIGKLEGHDAEIGRCFEEKPFWKLLEKHNLLRAAIGRHIHNKMDIGPALVFAHWQWCGRFHREKQVSIVAYAILFSNAHIMERLMEMMKSSVLETLGFSVQYRLQFYQAVIEQLESHYEKPTTTIFLSRTFSKSTTVLDTKRIHEWISLIAEQQR